MDNWVEKLDLVCESDARIGLIGSSFFIGLFCGLFIIPKSADVYGRKAVFNCVMIMSLVA